MTGDFNRIHPDITVDVDPKVNYNLTPRTPYTILVSDVEQTQSVRKT